MEQGTKTTPAVEVWRPIAGWEGLYEVSNLGRVRSIAHHIDTIDKNGRPMHLIRGGKVLKPWRMQNGYMVVRIHTDRINTIRLIHRLVAQAFIPNPKNLPEVNHKDQDKANNRADNLEWCDRIYNVNYADARERHKKAVSRPIEQLTLDGRHIAYYLGINHLCRNTNMNIRSIQRCLQCRYKSAYGYRWRYADLSKDEAQFATDTSLIQYHHKDTAIEQLTLNGQYLSTYPNISQAARAVGCDRKNIRRAAYKNQTAKGYRWRYVNNPGKEDTTHT